MSARTKNKGKAVDQSNDWSEWAWDDPNYQWYRGRIGADGNYEYEYRAPEETTPRSAGNAAGTSVNSWTAGGANQTPTYYESDGYGYAKPQPDDGDVTVVSETFARVNISTNERPAPTRFASYDNSSNQVADFSDAQPIPAASNPLRSDQAADYAHPSSAPAGGYMARNFDRRQSMDPRDNIPEDSTAFEQAPPAGLYSRGFSMTPNPTSFSMSPNPVSNLYAQPTGTTGGFSGGNFQPGFASSPQQHRDTGGAGSSGAVTPKAEPHWIKGTPGETEPLNKNFKLHKSDQWIPGRVFKVLWSEPLGENNSSGTVVTEGTAAKGKHGEKVYESIRRFVIVATGTGRGNHHSTCIPILTYGHQGALKSGTSMSSHAIVYMRKEGDKTPIPLPRDGENLTLDPIRVVPKSDRDKLHPDSRINYAKIYTVEHNVKVFFIGEVHKRSKGRLITAFNTIWETNEILRG